MFSRFARAVGALGGAVLIGVTALPGGALPVRAAAPTELFFSEYIEGSSNNKALEIYNGTGAAVDLATGGYNVQMFFNGNPVSALTINLTGTVASGDVFVLAQSSANATILAQADQTNGSGWFNGDDAVVLRKGTTVIDAHRSDRVRPGDRVGHRPPQHRRQHAPPQGHDLCRRPQRRGRLRPLARVGRVRHRHLRRPRHRTRPTAGPLMLPPSVTCSYPADGAAEYPVGADMSVTFSEPVNVTGDWFTLVCSVSGVAHGHRHRRPDDLHDQPDVGLRRRRDLHADGRRRRTSPTRTATTRPTTWLSTSPSASRTLDVCAQPYTPIPAIQGSGATVALTGTDHPGRGGRRLRGRVAGAARLLHPGPAGDGNPATSDGIFVFEGSNANTVSLGDLVRVTGTAGENQGQTQVSRRHDRRSAAPATVTPDRRDVPGCLRRLPRAVRGHAGPPAADDVRHRALPARAVRPGGALVRRPPQQPTERRRARRAGERSAGCRTT